MRSGTSWVTALLLITAACNGGGGAPPQIDVVVRTPSDANPLRGRDLDTLEIRVREDGADEVTTRMHALDGEMFDLGVPFGSLGNRLTMTVALTGPDGRLHGGPPAFVAADTGGRLFVPVGSPQSCVRLEGMSLETARSEAAVVRLGTFAVVVGGREGPDGRSSARATLLDLLRMSRGEVGDLAQPAGRAQGVMLRAGVALIVSAQGRAVTFDPGANGAPGRELPLHAAAGVHAAVTSRSGGGAVVIGGLDAEDRPVRDVSWVDADGTVRRTELAVARADAAAVPLGSPGTVLVAGGMASGEPLAEVIRPGEPEGRVVLDAPAHGVRDGALLLPDAAGERALLLGGVGADGEPRTDTHVVAGCAGNGGCTRRDGPRWMHARSGVARVRMPGGGGWLAGGTGPSDRVTRVRFDEGDPDLASWGRLRAARSDAGMIRVESGVVLIVGGRGADGARGDVEICFPRRLDGP